MIWFVGFQVLLTALIFRPDIVGQDATTIHTIRAASAFFAIMIVVAQLTIVLEGKRNAIEP